MSLHFHLKQKIIKLVQDLYDLELEVDLAISPPIYETDLGWPCFALASKLKRPLAEISSELIAKIELWPEIKEVKFVAGYLNFILDSNFLFSKIGTIIDLGENYGQVKTDQGLVMVEFSSPNTNKPLHVGHLRNLALGESYARILEKSGYQVVRSQLFNDLGYDVMKAMVGYDLWGQGQEPSTKLKGDHLIGKYYLQFNQAAQQDESLELKAKLLQQKIENQDQESLLGWQKLVTWVVAGIEQTYRRLGINFDKNYYERDVYLLGKEVVSELKDKLGLAYTRSDGAVEIDLTEFGLDKKVLLRSDGTAVYITQDLGLIKQRLVDFPEVKKFIFVVGQDQIYHFKVLFALLRQLGWARVSDCYHLAYGMVTLPAGKMSSRRGVVVVADDLLDQMAELVQKNSPSDLDQAAINQLSLGAIKYYLLHITAKQDLVFDPQVVISLDGNSGVYLLYAYVRAVSILKESSYELNSEIDFSCLGAESERKLVLVLDLFPQVVKQAVEQTNPALIAQYAYQLAKTFTTFYHQESILKAQSKIIQEARLGLVLSFEITLKQSLLLLGITPLNKF